MSEYKLTLSEPILHGEEKIYEVHFQKPRVKHLVEFDKEQGENAGLIRFLSALAGLPPKVIGQMVLDDLKELKEVFGDFLPREKQTSSEDELLS